MTPTPAYFPRPLPGELDIGHLARSQLLCGYRSLKAFLESLGANRSVLGSLLIADRWGSTVVEVLCAGCGLPPQTYALKHTLLPYSHGLSWDSSRPRRRAADLARLGRLHAFHRRSLRYCPRCCTEQEGEFGMRFWLREHQLPGMDWCLVHQVVLMELPIGILEPFPGCITPGTRVAVEPHGFDVPLVSSYLTVVSRMLRNATPLNGASVVATEPVLNFV